MFGQLMLGGALVAVASRIQCWSTFRRLDRKQVKKVDLPRWEDEGGSPHPDKVADTPAAVIEQAAADGGDGGARTAT